MGFIITTALLQGTNRKSHGQNSGLLEFLWKASQDSVPPYLQFGCVTLYYGVATISRLFKIIGLFCTRAL